LAFVGTVSADEKNKDEKKPAAVPFASQFSFPKQIKLTEEQQKKVEDLRKEYVPQLTALQQKIGVIITPERQKAAAEARKDKKGKEAEEAVQAAIKLTD